MRYEGEGPPQPPLWRERGFPQLVGVVVAAFVIAVLCLIFGVEPP